MFWRKVLDIYATSIDYDLSTETSQQFFATVQNKMHWAAHGHTAAELIALRADAQAPHMGMTNWAGSTRGASVRKADVGVAKNYLNAEELESLNRIVTAYIEVAELQAQVRDLPSQVEQDFEGMIAQPVKRLEKSRKALPKKKSVDKK